MCDVCGEVYSLLQAHDVRLKERGGLQLDKAEVLAVVNYVQIWQQRQCMCCYKDYKNYEKLNNVVQVILHRAIKLIHSLPHQRRREQQRLLEASEQTKQNDLSKASTELTACESIKCSQDSKTEEDNGDSTKEVGKDVAQPEAEKESVIISEKKKSSPGRQEENETSERTGEESGDLKKSEEEKEGSLQTKSLEEDDVDKEDETWTLEEKDNLFLFVSKVFLMNFPLYMAYKHCIHSSLEELSQQEAHALNNYCELSDPEIPVYLLRNVCFFCDSNGIASIAHCFDHSDPEIMPCMVAHTLITIVANLRLWMNIGTVMQNIVPIRGHIIRYMCRLSDKDLRMAGTRNMTDLMWAAIKEPIETQLSFDKEGLDLAFKYFTCSTLTIRLAGVTQINNQINLYNELANNDGLLDGESIGKHLADWLIEYRIIEQIFGPNLHVEIIKQSQMILNFLAVEGRLTKEHMDCMWAAAQLKHCGRQVMDILIPLIKNLEYLPAQHLLQLVSTLDHCHHTEQTLMLASTLIKFLWNTSLVQAQMCMQSHGSITQGRPIMKGQMKGRVSPSQRLSHKKGLPVKSSPCELPVIPGLVSRSSSVEGQRSDAESENSTSLCGQSDLSGASEEESGPFMAQKRLKVRIQKKRMLERSGTSDSELEVDSSDESDEEIIGHCCQEGCHHEVSEEEIEAAERFQVMAEEFDEEEDEEDEEEISVTDEEVRKHLKVVRVKVQQMDDVSCTSESDKECTPSKRKRPRREKLKQKVSKLGPKARSSKSVPNPVEKVMEYRHDTENCVKCQNGGHTIESEGNTDLELDTSGSLETAHKIALAESTGDTLNTSTEGVMLHDLEGHSSEGELSLEEKAFMRLKHSMNPEDLEYLKHLQAHGHHERLTDRQFMEDILSPDDNSCNSSHISNKSEKNMADFEGEDILSEEELAHINSQSHFGAHHKWQHISNLRLFKGMTKGLGHPMNQAALQHSLACVKFDDVCHPGNTLLWDLVQDDHITKLPEGLYTEAEKVLSSLVCFTTDRRIRTKFIEACVDNLAHHRSVVISLRLLPKIFSSFQQYRVGDTHTITMWAEKELSMMKHFFSNLVFYREEKRKGHITHTLYNHREEVQTRLQFLSCVFSCAVSPDNFRLNLEQVDTLWNCLALDDECSDDCFTWFLNQAKSKELHAMGLDTFKHIFMEKMPLLKPEHLSMMGLNLFTQLCQLAKMANASAPHPLPEEQIHGMDQLWGIALRAQNTDVSLTAIQYLNSHYINYGSGVLEKEEEFIQRCMDSLGQASDSLEKNAESSLLVIQRGLILLTNHLESFRKRYAFHLRMWQLEGKGISCHEKRPQDKSSVPIRVVLQPAGASEKTTVEMMSTSLVAELRAEVVRWWGSVQKVQQQRRLQIQQQEQSSNGSGSVLTPILGAMLGDGPIRMITLGQELSVDMDEKTLGEMQFKDMQFVFVSLGASRPARKQDGSMPASSLSSPDRNKLPMMLLLEKPHFGCLFNLLQQLSNYKPTADGLDSQELYSLQTKATVLSRKVWDLLMLLPTNQEILQKFFSIDSQGKENKDHNVDWDELLDAHNPHKLMYSLQIVETLSHLLAKHRQRKISVSGESEGEKTDEGGQDTWSKKFIACGGLSHLFKIFMCGGLQIKEGDHWNEWLQDCLAYLLRLITQFAVNQSNNLNAKQDDSLDLMEMSPRKRMKKQKTQEIIIPKLDQHVVAELDVVSVVKILMTILYEAALPSKDYTKWPSASWGRVEVMHYALSFLVSLAYTTEKVHPVLCQSSNFTKWLKRLMLEAPEPPVRQEACQGLYRLCLGRAEDGANGISYLVPVQAHLVKSLKSALDMKPLRKQLQEEKDPYGPGCRDYFWLACRLMDALPREQAQQSWQQEDCLLDVNELAKLVSQAVIDRPFLERRPDITEDHGLIGLLTLCTATIKHNPPFKDSLEGQTFLVEVFNLLFALPCPEKRFLPKCKSIAARSVAFDLLVDMVKSSLENYSLLHQKVLEQHSKVSHSPYSWDQWPHEDERSQCGYVGLTNLGATCYMATCMQHLYMIPEARKSVLEAKCSRDNRHEPTLSELKKMFAYLLESERKAYNPRSFCKVYTMDHQPLNTGEQKDMTEFFTDLISKMEEMGPNLRKLVKNLFGGVITNNVVSLDCPHVSKNKEEFYTVRCQVSDMKSLYESLDEVTVKDMLEGDNMYTCSKCQKKVRAEKRACFKRLPNILCFNTMRYTFNMVTMMKEKVNTHFSFPLQLDMAPYMEKSLISRDRLQADDTDSSDGDEADFEADQYRYELIGVTVHTGTADGGHYYSFIRDRLHKNELEQDKWFLFNDAEVKPFDPVQIAYECFGGEMTRKTYDTVTEKFMDFSFEKTNSAYMLFYERIKSGLKTECPESTQTSAESTKTVVISDFILEEEQPKYRVELSPDLAEWIWKDNMQFLQDKNIFEHTYFGFMWQMCGYIPTTLPRNDPKNPVSLMAAKLSASFVLETLIHSKEKPTMLQWIELVTKQFNACHAACEWFLDTMAEDDWWPQQILIKCPNQMVRQMFQRLIIHVINQLRPTHHRLYLHPLTVEDGAEEIDPATVGSKSCVTRFIRKLLSIIDHGTRPHCKYLTEYFAFFLEFARMGEHESHFLLHVNAIAVMIRFFMGHKSQESYVEILSDDEEEEEEVILVSDEKYRPQSLEKMITLISILVEKSRGEDNQLTLKRRDYTAILSGKNFPFIFNQIRDSINLRHSCNLIFSLCRWNNNLAKANSRMAELIYFKINMVFYLNEENINFLYGCTMIVDMIFGAITRLGSDSQPFFKMLSMLVEFVGGPPGLPPFTHYILQKYWEVAEYCPHQCLDWLATQVVRNKYAHTWTLRNLSLWVEPFLLAHNNVRVRNSAACLLVALVPSSHFRQTFRTSRTYSSPHKDNIPMSAEAVEVLHEIYTHLLRLLPRARQYVDAQNQGITKLVLYFAVMSYCLISKTEKLMFSHYFSDLWSLFHPKMSEPPIAMHHNKQALLMFWHQACVDCPENVKLIVSNSSVTKNIAFIYILADHEDQDVILFNRTMLPAYYAILRLCCQQSRNFTRQLSQHQNIQWAFKNITPYPTQYMAAVEELFRMMKLMIVQHGEATDDELKAITQFRRNTIQLYLQNLDARTSWQTLINALKILVESPEDKVLVVQLQGLPMMHEAFNTLHIMHHEATACHVTGDIVDLLDMICQVLKAARANMEKKKEGEVKRHLFSWKERMDFSRKLLSFLNSYTPPDVRAQVFECLRDMVLTYQSECQQTIVPVLVQAHKTFQDNNVPVNMGPYFPRRGQKTIAHKPTVRPPRPQFQMFLHSNQLEADKGKDEMYDAALADFFGPYHLFVDLLLRVAVNQQNLTEQLINLSAMVAYECVPLHMPYFAKLWYEIYQSEQIDKGCIQLLTSCSPFIEYVDAVLLDERQSLNNQHIYQFFCNYFPKVHQQVLNDQGQSLFDSLISSVKNNRELLVKCRGEDSFEKLFYSINGDLRALMLIFSVQQPKPLPAVLLEALNYMLEMTGSMQAKKKQAKVQALAKAQTPKKTPAINVAEEETADGSPAKKRRKSSEHVTDDDKPSTSAATTTSQCSQQDSDRAEPQPSTSADSQDSAVPSQESQSKNKTSESASSSESEKEEKEVKKTQGPMRRGTVKEKPTLLDLTVKNLETIFKLLKK